MTGNLPVISSREMALVHQSLSEGKISEAMNHFRRISISAPLPLLYNVYTELKHEMTSADDDSRKKFGVFNDLFLRMLEERGETGNGIYRSLLRDSHEFTYLNSLFSGKRPAIEIEAPGETIEPPVIEKKPPRITLKKIISSKTGSLLLFDISTWYDLVHEFLEPAGDEESFVKKCRQVLNFTAPHRERELYHLELVIAYAFEKLGSYKVLSVRSKDFAMEALNLLTDREPLWSKLHGEFLEIIKK